MVRAWPGERAEGVRVRFGSRDATRVFSPRSSAASRAFAFFGGSSELCIFSKPLGSAGCSCCHVVAFVMYTTSPPLSGSRFDSSGVSQTCAKESGAN